MIIPEDPELLNDKQKIWDEIKIQLQIQKFKNSKISFLLFLINFGGARRILMKRVRSLENFALDTLFFTSVRWKKVMFKISGSIL